MKQGRREREKDFLPFQELKSRLVESKQTTGGPSDKKNQVLFMDATQNSDDAGPSAPVKNNTNAKQIGDAYYDSVFQIEETHNISKGPNFLLSKIHEAEGERGDEDESDSEEEEAAQEDHIDPERVANRIMEKIRTPSNSFRLSPENHHIPNSKDTDYYVQPSQAKENDWMPTPKGDFERIHKVVGITDHQCTKRVVAYKLLSNHPSGKMPRANTDYSEVSKSKGSWCNSSTIMVKYNTRTELSEVTCLVKFTHEGVLTPHDLIKVSKNYLPDINQTCPLVKAVDLAKGLKRKYEETE